MPITQGQQIVTKKMEANRNVMRQALRESKEMARWRKEFQSKFGFDFVAESLKTEKSRFPVRESSFSFAKAREKLAETNVASGFPQLLRAGVQSIADSAYDLYDTTYESFTTVVNSKKDTELYAPLHGLSFPRRVSRQGKYPEALAAGLDISIKNEKFGDMLPIEWELYEDDQTGQMAKQAGMLGEYMRLLVEVAVYGKLASVSGMNYAGFDPEASATKPQDETNGYPWATAAAPFVGGGFNTGATQVAFNQANLQIAKTALRNQKNKLGIKMPVIGNRLILGTKSEFDAAILLNSAFYPSGAAAAGTTGGAFSINPIKGIADLTISPFIFNYDGTIDNGSCTTWYLADDSKPWFVVQLREALMVEQEAPNSGESFDRDVIRFKARMRGNFDFIDPRFIYRGNDGSV